jgi:isopenicillin N synthase-like dioxygenase
VNEIPSVDISRPSATSKQALDAACRDHGFFLLAGHGLDDLVERTWSQTRRFFDSNAEVKNEVSRSEENPLGYYDRELTKRRRDNKEVFDFMIPSGSDRRDRNQWPSALPGFRETLCEFFDAFGRLAADTLRLVHATLDLSEREMAAHCGSAAVSTVRLNHYPVEDPVPNEERADLTPLGDVALGHHTDPGVLTLLLQDETGGLQTKSRRGGWIDVPPRPGTIVVNLGDTLQVWTNDLYRASMHRVVPMTNARRYSIPYFFNPQVDAVIAPIPELCDGAPRFSPFSWREFIQARIDDNYSDLGQDDTQVDHFRIREPVEGPAGTAS